MSSEGDSGRSAAMSPDAAFDVLGNETRLGIVRELAERGQPTSFTELRNALGIRQGGQFNYHLDKLVGHFVEKTDGGYTLREPGRRVVESILSGAVTADPVVEPTVIDFTCHHCDAPVEVTYLGGTMRMSCTNCPGQFEGASGPGADADADRVGTLASYPLPPAGVEQRTAEEVMRAAATWGHLQVIAAACGVCPRCSAALNHDVRVCDDHDAAAGKCDVCRSRFAVRIHVACWNCLFEEQFTAVMRVLPVPELLAFVGDHGLNTTSRGIEWGWRFDEEIRSTDPFEGRFTFTIDGDSIAVTLDEELTVTDVERSDAGPADRPA